jgi:hypothetical protein
MRATVCGESGISSSKQLSKMSVMEKITPLATPRSEGVTFGSNMGTCAHHRAHENLKNLWNSKTYTLHQT